MCKSSRRIFCSMSLWVIGTLLLTAPFENTKAQKRVAVKNDASQTLPTRVFIDSHPDYPISVEVLRNAEDEANQSNFEKANSQRGIPILIEEQKALSVRIGNDANEITLMPTVLTIFQNNNDKLFGVGLAATGLPLGGIGRHLESIELLISMSYCPSFTRLMQF